MHVDIDPRSQPAAPAPTRRSRLLGRILVTTTLVGGLLGGWWALSEGKRLAQERKARVHAPGPAAGGAAPGGAPPAPAR